MKQQIHALRIKYQNNPGWCWLIAAIFLFPILPEYISPFILFAGFIVFKRQWTREGRKAKVGTLGKLEMVFMGLALLSTLWSSNKLDTRFSGLVVGNVFNSDYDLQPCQHKRKN